MYCKKFISPEQCIKSAMYAMINNMEISFMYSTNSIGTSRLRTVAKLRLDYCFHYTTALIKTNKRGDT